MHAASQQDPMATKSGVWPGRIMMGMIILFMLFDAAMKLLQLPVAIETSMKLGYPESSVFWIGVVALACTILYAVPATSVLGAILLTGYLGGAIATHVRASSGIFPIVFPCILGMLLWGGLFLTERRLRSLIPVRNSTRV